jgi:hypothetical protein
VTSNESASKIGCRASPPTFSVVLKTQLTAKWLVDTAPDTLQRFWARLRCPPLQSACWSWKPGLGHGAQPTLAIRGHPVQAARIAYLAVTGEWPLGFRRIRLCDNPLCVRPTHGEFVLGTTTRRALDAMHVIHREVAVKSDMEIAAARLAGVIAEIWDAD